MDELVRNRTHASVAGASVQVRTQSISTRVARAADRGELIGGKVVLSNAEREELPGLRREIRLGPEQCGEGPRQADQPTQCGRPR